LKRKEAQEHADLIRSMEQRQQAEEEKAQLLKEQRESRLRELEEI